MRPRIFLRFAPIVGLAALVLAFFSPLAAEGKALVFRDLVVYEAPQDRSLREAILERGELPAKNPWLYAGVEYAADPCSQVFYPPRLVTALAFAVPRSLSVYVVFHFALACCGAFLLGRALRARRLAAAAGAAVYAFSGPVLSLEENFPLLAGAAWLPFALAFALRATRSSGKRRRRALVLSSLAIALAVLGGDLQGATWASLLALAVLVPDAVRRSQGRRESARSLLQATLPVALALGLAAVVLLPARDLLARTDRRDGVDARAAGRWSLAPARLAELIVPFPFGRSFPEGRTFVAAFERNEWNAALGTWERSPVTEPWCETIHAGVLGLALGGLALFDPRRRGRAWPLVGLFAFALLCAMGPRLDPLAPWRFLRGIVPFYDVFRYPEKHAVLAALAASGLASLGVDALGDRDRRGLAGLALLAGSVGCLVFVWLLSGTGGFIERWLEDVVRAAGRPSPGTGAVGLADEAQRSFAWRFVLGFVLAGFLLDGARLLGGFNARASKTWIWLAPLVVAADVALATWPRLYVGDATLYDERPLGADIVRASGCRVLRWPRRFMGGPVGRVFAESDMPGRRQRERATATLVRSWAGSVAANERVPSAHGFASFTPLAIEQALPETRLLDPRELDRLSVRYLVLDEEMAASAGLPVVARSPNGAVLVDRGEGVPRAPPATYRGEVRGLAAGAVLTAISLLLAALAFFLPGKKTGK